MAKSCVFFEARTEFLNINCMNLGFKGLMKIKSENSKQLHGLFAKILATNISN
jgi:hypothetical protein